MYGYTWTKDNGIFRLGIDAPIQKEIRPVFAEELDFFEMANKWKYKASNAPLLWAEGIRRYVKNGVPIADAKGGGFYTKPKIVPLSDKQLKLSPINLEKLWAVNEELMNGLIQKSIAFIRDTYDKYASKGYKFVVAFSGGKDSLVLLDLVQRALAPDQFVVIFGDTGMELSDTYKAVEKARTLYPTLNFHVAKSWLPANETWKKFGPPGRRLRWCCAVHKSVPTLLLLKELSHSSKIRAVVFDGVRSEESAQRATYADLSEGQKHSTQVNCSVILKWNTAEVYLYLLHRDILINAVYRKGLFRCGCAVCPMSSNWWDGITNILYKEDLAPFLKEVEDYSKREKPESEVKKYIEQGGWKGRFGGRGIIGGGNRVHEVIEDNTLKLHLNSTTQEWLDVAPLLGSIIERDVLEGEQSIRKQWVNFKVTKVDAGVRVEYSPFDRLDRISLSWIRGVANKVAYCVGCKVCMVECPTQAFTINDHAKISIDTSKCIHCGMCITGVQSACWAAKSLRTTTGEGQMDLKGINRYQHFGLSTAWIEHFFEIRNDCWTSKRLGNRQYDSLRVWLREAGIIESNARSGENGLITPVGECLMELGPYNPLTWAVIWTHLVHNSVLMKWYAFCVPPGDSYDRNDFITMLGDSFAEATRSNAILSLSATFNDTPIGGGLEIGIPVTVSKTKKFLKQGWTTPDPFALLYSLYLYAEKIGGHYDFTVRELLVIGRERKFDLPAVDPITIFALNPDTVKDTFQELANQYSKYLKVSFVAGLDNIQLDSKITSLDILKAAVDAASKEA